MITPEIAVLGVDQDCSSCAEAGIDRLAEAVPDVDWWAVLHATLHRPDPEGRPRGGNHPYWCDLCSEAGWR